MVSASSHGSAWAVIDRQAASTSSSSGVEPGAPLANRSWMSGYGVVPWPRVRK